MRDDNPNDIPTPPLVRSKGSTESYGPIRNPPPPEIILSNEDQNTQRMPIRDGGVHQPLDLMNIEIVGMDIENQLQVIPEKVPSFLH